MNSVSRLQEAEQALFQIFSGIDATVKQNLQRVLKAFRSHRVGVHHFAGVTGYGHDDLGRETLDGVFAEVVGAEAAAVRVQFVSGTHAIACALFGILRPGDEMLAVAGSPYDTLEEVIGLRGQGQGSLIDFGILYRELPLTREGSVDWQALSCAISAKTRLVLIQRSCGYSWRSSLSISEIKKIVTIVKHQNPNTICFVDNCYGEFVDDCEPTAVGADMMAGSLIKNPGGTIVPAGGYVAGRADLVEAATCRLTAPGIGSSGGATFDLNRLLFQGLFLAPGFYRVNPIPLARRRDVIQAIEFGSADKLIAFCRAVQQNSPVGSYLDPVPAPMPGYESQLVMAGGTFIDGSTSEFSADGPLREPYVAFCQGGTHWTHVSIALEAAIEAVGPAK
ncbi:MAG: aminotransferase class I/II-fold pyridoxal phosphate-dependent enzyme [Oscillatoriales cyanobacterium]|nr:MAG: aminotransferase class I/II-fold pyridoxal phosphate-dependent enzyme [Oscillatoriales cyanobacterium]